MEPESEDGNIEYKLKLLDKSDSRVERLASQMKFRCHEGNGECIYNIGVADDGTIVGLNDKEFNCTIECLEKAAKINNYSLNLLRKTIVPEETSRFIYELYVRELNQGCYIDIKVAIAGNVDCGKSTLLSVLTTGLPDNGKGLARLKVFNYPHEVETGRTSSIGHQILGYDESGRVMNYSGKKQYNWPEIVKKSSKVISFYDLAGHEKYLKTTIFGLASGRPDICLVMVAANKGLNQKIRMTLEHMFLCKTLGIPFVIVVTKIDMTHGRDNVLETTLSSISSILKKPGIRRIPIRVKTSEDIIRCAMHVHSQSIVPIFSVSNVSMEGIDKIHEFLNLTPKRVNENKIQNVEMHCDHAWMIQGVGTVVGGHLLSGTVKIGDKLWYGPSNNAYIQVYVRTIHCKRVSVQQVSTPTYICLSVKGVRTSFTKQDFCKGSVLLGSKSQQVLCKKMVVDVEVLKSHSTTIKLGYQPIMHAHHVRTSVNIDDITNKNSNTDNDDKILRTGDTARITLSPCFDRAIFVKKDSDILLCEGRTKVIGVIVDVIE